MRTEESWLLNERAVSGAKSAVDFVVAGTTSLLTNIALQPDPELAAFNPDLARRCARTRAPRARPYLKRCPGRLPILINWWRTAAGCKRRARPRSPMGHMGWSRGHRSDRGTTCRHWCAHPHTRVDCGESRRPRRARARPPKRICLRLRSRNTWLTLMKELRTWCRKVFWSDMVESCSAIPTTANSSRRVLRWTPCLRGRAGTSPSWKVNWHSLPELGRGRIVRIDVPSPRPLNLRMPSGNELGANPLWIPGGKLLNGELEAVIDQIKREQYVENPLWR